MKIRQLILLAGLPLMAGLGCADDQGPVLEAPKDVETRTAAEAGNARGRAKIDENAAPAPGADFRQGG
jgi:hypothetical protein